MAGRTFDHFEELLRRFAVWFFGLFARLATFFDDSAAFDATALKSVVTINTRQHWDLAFEEAEREGKEVRNSDGGLRCQSVADLYGLELNPSVQRQLSVRLYLFLVTVWIAPLEQSPICSQSYRPLSITAQISYQSWELQIMF